MDTPIRKPTRRSRIASFGIAITVMALAFVSGFTIGALVFYPKTPPGFIGFTDESQPTWASHPPPGTITPTDPA